MGRFLAFLVFVLVVIAVCWGLTLLARLVASRHRQKMAARFAPEMLRYENLPTDVVEAFIQQRKQLHGAQAIMFKLVNDPYFTLNTEYYTVINRWLDRQKEITK